MKTTKQSPFLQAQIPTILSYDLPLNNYIISFIGIKQ
jgi:hypothetical protein